MSNEIEPKELKKRIDDKKDILLLDVRTPEEYDAWKISYGEQQPLLIPITQLSPDSKVLKNIPKDKEVITVCSHGNRSGMAAQMLSRLGYNVKTLKGGMVNWNSVQDVAPVPLSTNLLRIWQVRRIGKGCMGYLVASMNDKTAVVIDPVCDSSEAYMQIARENGLRITKVIDTHMHADHVSGVAKLCQVSDANPYLSLLEGYEVTQKGLPSFKPIKDGDRIEVGQGVALTALSTPGHTKGSMCFSLIDDGNKYLLTGDTLFVDGISRPDLRDKAKEFASDLYNTLHQKILNNFPEETQILPCHYSTSIRVTHGKLISNTLGTIKRQNKLLALPKNEFISQVITTVPPRPVNYRVIIGINKNMIPCDESQMRDIEAGPNSCGVQM
jgi:glyoxylase-like metal-dependent hydrolase (beta-lactamase superfamily II)/rhodanese-related sulfurtransferase